MKNLRNIVLVGLLIFLFFSLIKNLFDYQSKLSFYQSYKDNYEAEKKENIELKTQIVKKNSVNEVEKTIRNDLNLLRPNEVAIIIPSPTPEPNLLTPTPEPPYLKWWRLFFR